MRQGKWAMAWDRNSTPDIPGMRWSERNNATESPRFFQLIADIERRLAGSGAQDPVVRSVAPAQVLHDGLKDANIIVHREYDWLSHAPSLVYFVALPPCLRIFDRQASQSPLRQQLACANLPLSWSSLSCLTR